MKTCTKCGEENPATTDYFYRNRTTRDGLDGWCKSCKSSYGKKYWAEHKDDFKEQVKERNKRYYAENQDREKERQRQWREKNREHCIAYAREWVKANPERSAENKRNYQRRPQRKLYSSVSRGVRKSLLDGKDGRSWESVVGYSRRDLMSHLESQFQSGMTWDNYGEWHIDHIRPISDFNFTSPDDSEFKVCWSLWNLQPMWGLKNQSKGAKCKEPPLPLLTGEEANDYNNFM